MSDRRGVMVAHPVRQHSHQLARALEETGALNCYLTMLPTKAAAERWPGLLTSVVTLFSPLASPLEIDRSRVRYWSLPWLAKRGLDRIIPISGQYATSAAAFAAFDRWAASHVERLRPDVVVAYEVAAVATFRAARKLGAKCVLDAASFASPTQDRLIEKERRLSRTAVGRWVRKRKAAEVAMADLVLTCSEIAAASYREAGVDPRIVIANPPGCDVAGFGAHPRTAGGPVKFCFVGHATDGKGFELLLEAFSKVRTQHPEAELHVFGDRRAARAHGATAGQGGVTLHGKKTHQELAVSLSAMDVLVMPSYLDSFGMAVAEGLAAGVYSIVSTNVGAGMLITDETIGHIFPAGDTGALTALMSSCAARIQFVRDTADRRSDAARSADWAAYRARSGEILRASLAPRTLTGRVSGGSRA